MHAELDIFSGRPNPRWTLSDEEAAAVRQLLARLPPAAGEPPAVHDGLGYRGIILTDTANQPLVTVWRSVVRDATAPARPVWSDQHRTVEKYLLGVAQAHLDPALFEFVKSQVDESPVS